MYDAGRSNPSTARTNHHYKGAGSMHFVNPRIKGQGLKTKGTASGPVKTYKLTEEELEKYRALPVPTKEVNFSKAKMH